MGGGVMGMYGASVDEIAGKEIVAATAGQRDPEAGDDGVLAEDLFGWIGAAVDQQVAARLAERAAAERAARSDWGPAVMGVGSLACGLAATAIVVLATATNVNGRFDDSVSGTQFLLVALIWAVVGVVNVVYARRR